MASIRKQNDRYEIRECLVTLRGPRQLSLASFRGVLTPEVLDEAEAKARKPFNRADLVARAARMGIPVSDRRRYPEARGLLAALQRGAELEPTLVQAPQNGAPTTRLSRRSSPSGGCGRVDRPAGTRAGCRRFVGCCAPPTGFSGRAHRFALPGGKPFRASARNPRAPSSEEADPGWVAGRRKGSESVGS